MRKFSHFLFSRSAVAQKLLSGKASNIKDSLCLHNSMSCAGISTARQDLSTDGKSSGIVWVDYSIFKGKAALSMIPVLPKFINTDFGGARIEKRGCVLLKFWPAIPGQQHKYDYEKKQLFALSATELGSLISLGPTESCEFFHDPSMKTSLAGQVRKSLSVSPLSTEGSGYFFNLSVVNSNLKTNERFSVPVTKAEFAVMRQSFSFILPHIMGWDRVTHPPQTRDEPNPPNRSEQAINRDLEWDR